MRLRACLLAIAVVLPTRAFAQTPPPAAPPPAPEKPAADAAPAAAPAGAPAPAAVMAAPPAAAVTPPPAAPAPTPKFVFGGLVDTYYMYNFTPPSGANSLSSVQPAFGVGRAFDTNSNSITLALAKLTMNASLDVVSLQLDLGYGSVGSIINGAAPGSSPVAPPVGGAFLVEQAFGEITLPVGLPSFTLDFGKFTTTAGAEVIEANKNWLYSRSLLFNAIPLLHTGARANLKINDNLTLQASLVNGWNNDPDLNAWKTGGVSASITVNPMLSIVATTYFGKEGQPQPAGGSTPGDLRFLADLVAALTVNSQFGLNLNVDYIKAFDDVASDYQIGAALMGRYVISDRLNVAARGEFLASHVETPPGGIGPQTEKQGEGTIMLGVDVGKNFELRPELRADFGSSIAGMDVFAGGTKNSEFTGEIAALTWF
jgi:Putative beta-barrel porin-2, OmpL-like. bbp2